MPDEVFYYVDRFEPESVTIPSLLLNLPLSHEAFRFYVFLCRAEQTKSGFYLGAKTVGLIRSGIQPERGLKELVQRRLVSSDTSGEKSWVCLNPTHLWHTTSEPLPLDTSTLTLEQLEDIVAFKVSVTPEDRLQVLIESWFRGGKDFHQRAAELNLLPYDDFLRSSFWRIVREYVLARARHRCELCSSKKNLNVHHKTYKHHGLEHIHTEDLIALCKRCHAKFHDKLKN